MTKKQQIRILRKQIKAMVKTFEENCLEKTVKAVNGGFVPAEYIEGLENNSQLLSKAIIDAEMRIRPYKPLWFFTRADEFDNIYKQL
jgi:hypothetical protein